MGRIDLDVDPLSSLQLNHQLPNLLEDHCQDLNNSNIPWEFPTKYSFAFDMPKHTHDLLKLICQLMPMMLSSATQKFQYNFLHQKHHRKSF